MPLAQTSVPHWGTTGGLKSNQDMSTDDKFQRFLELTDHPERFSDEELMQLVHDPQMAAWYEALCCAEEAVKERPALTAKPHGRKVALMVSWAAAAAAVLVAVMMLPALYFNSPQAEKEQSALTEPLPKSEKMALAEVRTDDRQPAQPEAKPNVVQPQLAKADGGHRVKATHETKRKQPVAADRTTEKAQAPVPEASAPPHASAHEPLLMAANVLPTHGERTTGVHDPLVAQGSVAEVLAEPPISAEKQALVDMFLAETALQVAYEQQAQRERVRAYLMSLIGNDPENEPQIIAF